MTKKAASKKIKRALERLQKPEQFNEICKVLDRPLNEIISNVVDIIEFSQTPEYLAIEKITFLKYFYEHEKPLVLYAWKAISIAQEFGMNLPLWAVSVVTSKAGDIIRIQTTKNEFHKSLCGGVGFDGQDLKTIQKISDMLDIYFEMVNLVEIENPPKSMTASADILSHKYGYSRSSIISYYKKYNLILEKHPFDSPFEDFEQKV